MPKRYHTMEEVRTIAATYGLDSLATEEKNSGLQIMPETAVHDYFKRQKVALEARKEFASFRQRTIWANSFEDYIALIDSLPIKRQKMIDGYGGPEKWPQYIDTVLKTKWRVYRLKEGGVGFEYPERAAEHPERNWMN